MQLARRKGWSIALVLAATWMPSLAFAAPADSPLSLAEAARQALDGNLELAARAQLTHANPKTGE